MQRLIDVEGELKRCLWMASLLEEAFGLTCHKTHRKFLLYSSLAGSSIPD